MLSHYTLLASTVVFGAVAWVAYLFLISRLSGWRRLEKLYPAPKSPNGGEAISSTLSLGGSVKDNFPVAYGRTSSVKVSREGLRIELLPGFRIFHRPLLVPWTAILNVSWSYRRKTKSALVQISGAPCVLGLSEEVGKAVENEMEKFIEAEFPQAA